MIATSQGLTERELTVLTLLRGGLSQKEVTRELGKSRNTIKLQVGSIGE